MDGLGRSSGHGVVKKEEIIVKRPDFAQSSNEDCKQKFDMKSGRHEYTEISDDDTKQSSPKQVETTKVERSSSNLRPKEKLESTKAEMGEVLEENERLKIYLDRIVKDYKTLKKQFDNVVVQQEAAKSHRQETEESELISLSLGSFSGASAKIKDEKNKSPSNYENVKEKSGKEAECLDREGLSLGMDCKFVRELSSRSGATEQGGPAGSNPSAGSSFEEAKEEAGETWLPSKALKPLAKRSGEQDEISQAQNPAKKARVCVRARCDTPTMIDGCQWRKYGQKIAKGNPCPRAYYRCTVAPLCPVRKQVQRCAEDMSVLITTYEGTHNHALPVAATAMASTTSAAASMLLSGSSSSITARPSDAGLGFTTFDSFKWNNSNIKPQFHLPNAFSSSHPTVTLDLTSSTLNKKIPHSSSSSSSSSMAQSYHHLNSSNVFPSTSLSFGSSESSLPWSHHHGFFNYNSSTPQQVHAFGLKNQMQNPNVNGGNYFQNYMQQKMMINPNNPGPSPSVGASGPDLAAATKAITADPAFQSALAAALTSIIGGGGGGQVGNLLPGELVQNLMRSSDQRMQFPAGGSASGTAAGASTASFLQGNNNIAGCASTFLKNTATAVAGSQPATGSLMFLSSNNSVSFSSPKSASSSPGDTRDQQTSPT